MSGSREPKDVVAVTGELISTRRVGAFVAHTFVAAGIAELARPGQLVSLAVGDDASAIVTRRALPLRSVTPSGTYGGTVEVVVEEGDADLAGVLVTHGWAPGTARACRDARGWS